MRRLIASVGMLAVLLAVFAVGAWSNDSGVTVPIKVSPGTIVLASRNEMPVVTVHADIPYSQVAVGSVALNGLGATLCFADDRGDLVAKFSLAKVKAMVSPPEATLTLTGATKDGTAFSGSDTVPVKK